MKISTLLLATGVAATTVLSADSLAISFHSLADAVRAHGHCSKVDSKLDPATRTALIEALQDERKAQQRYAAVMERFGEVLPLRQCHPGGRAPRIAPAPALRGLRSRRAAPYAEGNGACRARDVHRSVPRRRASRDRKRRDVRSLPRVHRSARHSQHHAAAPGGLAGAPSACLRAGRGAWRAGTIWRIRTSRGTGTIPGTGTRPRTRRTRLLRWQTVIGAVCAPASRRFGRSASPLTIVPGAMNSTGRRDGARYNQSAIRLRSCFGALQLLCPW